MKSKVLVLSILFLLLSNACSYAWNYPEDGKFKQHPTQSDPRFFKEYKDAYREGWSARDLAVDAMGILVVIYYRAGAKVLCTYDQEKIMLNLVFPLK